jgi:poly(3-hydroxybutyrate) depolymerase
LGHYNQPGEIKLTESAVNRLPDGTWMAICRQEEGTRNYTFAHSTDGRNWSANRYLDFVGNGTNSKPVFERFNGIYYLGWQEATQIEGVHRSVFNIDVSRDGKNWERKYRFETIKSFQYPALREHQGTIYLTVTQGDSAADRKERIMFGKLEGKKGPEFPESTLLQSDICVERLHLACQWLADIAQVKNETMVAEKDRKRHQQISWTGALRGEYRPATGQWEFFCPIWHTGQAVKALVMASYVLGDEFMDSAILGGEFILKNRITEGPDKGLILAYEDLPDIINTSAILEGLDGLFMLSAKTGNPKYRDAALAAVEWVQRNAVIDDKGLLRDHYDPLKRIFKPVTGVSTEGRPLLDDAVFLTAYQLTGNKEYLRTAEKVAARLLADEEPSGNWINYHPCNRQTGLIHPRQCYWWGHPMLAMYQFSNEKQYRAQFLRSCEWYQHAIRRDGGLLRNTYLDFNTDSFGHATSGAAAAISMFLDAWTVLDQKEMWPFIERGLSFCMRLQFTNPKDPNLHGCILEKVLEPDGTDASPYMIRDLGTIFFIQAMAKYLVIDPSDMTGLARGEKATIGLNSQQPEDLASFRKWQAETRATLKKMLGIPAKTVELAPDFGGQFEWDGIVIEKWVFTAESGSQVPAVLYRPVKSAQKMPAIVLTFGHGGSKSQWQYNYAGQLYARMGLACLALDPIGEEERHALGHLGTRAHDPQSVSDRADQAGRLIMGKLLFDTMRGIDFLLQRGDIDPQRIGVVGNSLGGAIASWMAALEPRLKMAIITGWAYDDILLTAGKLCTNLPNQRMREKLTWTDYAKLPAPDCAVLLMNGAADVIIDQKKDGSAWTGTQAVTDSASRVYERLGAKGKIRYWLEANGGHRPYFLRKEALEWIQNHLGAPAMTQDAVKTLPTINSGLWCDQHGIVLEKLYGTELHQRGDVLTDLNIRPTPKERLSCLKPAELGLPEFTIEGWLQQIETAAKTVH